MPWIFSTLFLPGFVSGSVRRLVEISFAGFYALIVPKLYVFQWKAAFCLARSTNEGTYRLIGEQSVRTMTKMVQRSEWNFTNKLHLLNAQLHYLDKRNNLAENSFKAAIASAHEHGFYHEEALACELYGLFLIDTKNLVVGIEQLQSALHKYEKWGAKKKSQDVQFLIDSHVVNAFLPGSTTTK